ncbi:tRNA (adenine(22)-N(1))-methyltransferase [Heyndrickxia sporothermodurans]|uniref:tRNA (adenine(22)-N(1))-methyltransferase n=1 Tax=Heyndrickxia sporothermodurans TaxID=46224 RepID=UPI002E206D64|nr:tRNA (adenine(22)-N(1))-methyltransferase TrmK [Heyndrickxia sporothermodurans]MED3696720.1 tRNA (adenine(22)-N(1))-methyltransferase TrmK [Heyndrickxia sporothermodurans]
MNIDKLSKRLETVSKYIIKDSIFADIGSDHAYLPCYAINKGLAKAAIAGEIVDGPYQTALQQVKEAKLENKISVRKGDGLEVIEANEVDCITIAGMGGGLITSILEKGAERLEGVQRLILQPNIGAHHIRNWCVQNNWELINEEIIEEDEKIYEILVASKIQTNESYKLTDASLLLGPFLMKEKNEAFKKKWTEELKQWKNILEKMNEAEDPDKISERKEQLKKNIMLVKEVLK